MASVTRKLDKTLKAPRRLATPLSADSVATTNPRRIRGSTRSMSAGVPLRDGHGSGRGHGSGGSRPVRAVGTVGRAALILRAAAPLDVERDICPWLPARCCSARSLGHDESQPVTSRRHLPDVERPVSARAVSVLVGPMPRRAHGWARRVPNLAAPERASGPRRRSHQGGEAIGDRQVGPRDRAPTPRRRGTSETRAFRPSSVQMGTPWPVCWSSFT
jgi:hypothetical protein